MRYTLKLTAGYEFDHPTQSVKQALRVMPAHIEGDQRVIAASLRIDPEPVYHQTHYDFFGTRTDDITLPAGHDRFDYEVMAQIEKISRGRGLDITPTLGRLREELQGIADLGGHSPLHFIENSPRVKQSPDMTAYARDLLVEGMTVRRFVKQLGEALNADMAFDPNATFVDTPPEVAFAQRRGVCQDFTHIMIAALRGLGVPAAYVSGFLRTVPPEGQERLAGSDAMHAWVRIWGGIERGWFEYDPTNAMFAGGDHLVIGYGRDYADIAPIRGVLRFSGGQRTFHAVDLEVND